MPIGLRERLRFARRALVGIFDDSSLEQAHGMLAGVFPGAVGPPPQRGALEYLRAYSTMPWFRAVVGKIAYAVAATDWRLYVAQRPGATKAHRNATLQRAPHASRVKLIRKQVETGELREITEHPFYGVLNDANPFQTGIEMRLVTQVYIESVGEAFWLKERDGLGTVVGVWPIPPNWILSAPTPTNRFFRVGYRGWQKMIPDTEFVWFRHPNPEFPYGRGSGTAQSLGDELETDEFAAKHTKNLFRNQARPDFVVFPKSKEGAGGETFLRKEEVSRLREEWLSITQGYQRSWMPYFANREIGIHEFGDPGNLRAMQFVPLRQHERDTIMQTWGIPPELLGVIENSNRSTIAAADYLFAAHVLVPRLEVTRGVFQERLIPEYDERLIVDYVSPVQEDEAFKLEVARSAPWAQTVDEWRERMGLAPLEDDKGQVFAVPFNLLLQEELTPGGGGGANGGGGAPAPPALPAPPKASRERMAHRELVRRDARAFRDAGDPDGESAALKAIADDPEDLPALSRLAARLEPGLRRRFLDAVEAAKREIDLEGLAQALASGHTTEAEAQARLEVLRGKLDGLVPLLRQGFMLGARQGHEILAAAGLSMSFDLVNPYAEAWVGQHAGELITEVTAQTQQAVRELVGLAFSGEMDVRTVAREIRDVVGLHSRQAQAVENFRARLADEGVAEDVAARRVERYAEAQLRLRAQTIARNETLVAGNNGQLSLWREATVQGLLDPTKAKKMWIVTHDDRLDPECEALDGVQVGFNEPFPGGIQSPPLHIQCRCSFGLVFA